MVFPFEFLLQMHWLFAPTLSIYLFIYLFVGEARKEECTVQLKKYHTWGILSFLEKNTGLEKNIS